MNHRVTVLGTSYLGATHATCMADLGFDVLGLDVDADKIAELSAGRLPFHEPGLEPLLRRGLDSGRLRFTTSYEEVAEFGDVHFLCIGTPQQPGEHAADLSYLEKAVTTLAPLLRRECLVVGKSTVPTGTADRLAELVKHLAPAGDGVELAWNPEFLREGHAVTDTMRPDRIVIGVRSERAERVLRDVYASALAAGVPLLVCDYATAELVKVAANAFLATKVSFINAMAEICEVVGADVAKLAEALAYDERIGGNYLRPGLGFGGGCIPKDIRAFIARARELGVGNALAFLAEVDEVNLRRRARTAELAREMVGGSFAGHAVAILGAAFKPNSDDIRDSPALDVAATIHQAGGRVTVYDPVAMPGAERVHPELAYAETALDACRDAAVVLHLTEWREFRELDPSDVGKVVAHRNIVDGRGALDADRWCAAGWTYRALGTP